MLEDAREKGNNRKMGEQWITMGRARQGGHSSTPPLLTLLLDIV